MAPIGPTNTVQLKLREAFSHDPVFADCWSTLENQRDQFKHDCNDVHNKIFGDTQLKSIALLAPSSLPEYIQLRGGTNNGSNGSNGGTTNGNGINGSSSPSLTSNGEGENGFTFNFNANGSNIYKIIVDMHQFNPYAYGLYVKTSTQEKNIIIIEGGHKEKKEGHGTIARQFVRKCILPFDIKQDEIQANLSSDGVLLINIPLKITVETKRKRELMTVDGRKLEEADVDLTRLDSKKMLNGNGSSVVNREQLKNWTPKIQTLPDFDMVPFWCRKYSPHYQEQNGLGIQNDKENFNVLVDVKSFLPEEISVRCTDKFVIIEGNQEPKQDPFGFLTRQFIRKYELPNGIKADGMTCNMNSGILQIKAPKPKPRTVDNTGYGIKIPIAMSDHHQHNQNAWLQSGMNKISTAPGANQRVYVPPSQARQVAAKVADKSQMQANGRDSSDEEGRRTAPIHVNGDAHSERTIIPFVAAAGN